MKKTILAIDDSKAIRFLIQTVLGKKYNVITAPDGCSAMYWLSQRNMPDLIICDPQLPDMKDWELIEELSNSVLYRNIPVAVISSLDKNITHSRSQELGVSAYFTKPFNPLALLETVNNMISQEKPRERFATSLS